jgi:hypothetical protein
VVPGAAVVDVVDPAAVVVVVSDVLLLHAAATIAKTRNATTSRHRPDSFGVLKVFSHRHA